MKQFIKHIVIFSLIILTFFICSFLFLSTTHKYFPSPMYFSNEFEEVFTNSQSSELLAVGNSKLLSSLDKRTLEKQLNLKTSILGYSSSDISTTRLILESYLNKHKKRPQVILMEVSWFTFNTNRTGFHAISGELFLTDPKLWKYFYRYYPQINTNLKGSIKQQVIQSFSNSKNIDYGIKKTIKSPNSKDYLFEMEDFEKVFPTHKAGIDDLLLSDFYEIVNMCKRNNIVLILYTAPEDEEFIQNQIDKEKIKSIFKDEVNNTSVFYLDYTKDLWKKKYEFWLLDSHHINEDKSFTKVLVKDIKTRAENVLNK